MKRLFQLMRWAIIAFAGFCLIMTLRADNVTDSEAGGAFFWLIIGAFALMWEIASFPSKNRKKELVKTAVLGGKILACFAALVGIFILLSNFTLNNSNPPAAKPAPQQYSHLDYLAAVNKERQKRGLEPLVLDDRLEDSAHHKAKELSKEPDTDNDLHTNAHGVQGYTYAFENVANCDFAGEVIAEGYDSPKDTVYAWMHSPIHKKVLLDSRFSITGFGMRGGYIVEHFCEIKVTPAVAPVSGPTAQCRDGSYSYSAHHQGTCSHHGGVAVWYR